MSAPSFSDMALSALVGGCGLWLLIHVLILDAKRSAFDTRLCVAVGMIALGVSYLVWRGGQS